MSGFVVLPAAVAACVVTALLIALARPMGWVDLSLIGGTGVVSLLLIQLSKRAFPSIFRTNGLKALDATKT